MREVGRRGNRWYDRPRMVLLAFLVGLGLSLAGLTVVVLRALALWRQVKRSGGAIGAELSAFEERAGRAEAHLAQWERASADLDRALQRLRESRARLQVLLDGVERAQARVRWLRVFFPR